jgi:hypothetical protein
VKKWIVVFLAAFISLSATAQESDMQSLPGYVDFGVLDSVYGEPRVRINIGGTLLKFMSAVSRDDPEAAALMRNLEGVRVNVYSTSGQMDPAREQIAKVRQVLGEESWEPIVQVRESDEEVQIFIKADEAGMQGLTVMTVNEEEAVFINILGEMDPTKLGVVLDQLKADVHVDQEALQ